MCIYPHTFVLQEHLVHEGMAWIDDQADGSERLYWFPGLFETTASFRM